MVEMQGYAPLCKRVFVGDVGESIAHHCECLPSRPFRYKGWSQESMTLAIRDGMTVRGAAEYYSVQRSTLGDRISGRVLPGAKSGPATHLTSKEEEELVSFPCRSALVGHARTRKEVMAIVNCILSAQGASKDVSPGWWSGFVSRHPELTLRTPATLSISQAIATDPVVIDSYFDELERTLEQNDLIGKPCQIFKWTRPVCLWTPHNQKLLHGKDTKTLLRLLAVSRVKSLLLGPSVQVVSACRHGNMGQKKYPTRISCG